MGEILYHYCSINTLELILKHQTIRFSSLSTVDDIEESTTAEDINLGKVCFVSCWTDLEQDTIEMWRSYTDTGKGVRIGLPKDFFNKNLGRRDPLDAYHEIKESYDISLNPPYVPRLIPITYTKDNTLIKLSVLKESIEKCDKCGNESHSLHFDLRLLGKFKRDIWSHQSEWRYVLFAIPYQYLSNNLEGKYLDGSLKHRLSLMKSDLLNIEFNVDFIDYRFDRSIFEDLEILTSPLNSEKEKQDIRQIMNENLEVNQICIRKSGLQIRR